MPVALKVPEVGESITEVIIGEWLKREGDLVDRDEDLVIIETDKATMEISAPAAGTLTQVVKKSGDTAVVGEVIGYLETEGTAGKHDGAIRKTELDGALRPESTSAEEGPKSKEPSEKPPAEPPIDAVQEREPVKVEAQARSQERRVTAARAMGAEKEKQGAEDGAAERTAAAEVLEKPPTAQYAVGTSGREEEVRPMTPIRRRIAERLVQAQQTAAFLTTFNEIDMWAVNALRQEYQHTFRQKYGIKLGLMSFFVKAAVDALQLVPQLNAEIRGANIVYRNYCDIGVAVGGGKGLVVPVLRDAQNMTFAVIEQTIADFARRATTSQLKPDDLEGGTFTISNGGIYGSLLSTPIINPPQSGILGMHAIQQRPVARDGSVVIRPMMYVALTYDHRIVDGREAVVFLKRIKECVESPARLLLGA